MIAVESICKDYSGINVLKDISFELFPGEIVSMVGHNGAGKTTILKIITGLITQDTGRVLINGELRQRKHLNNITMMLESNRNFYSEITIYQNIKYLYRIKGYKYTKDTKELVNRYLKLFNLTSYANEPIYKLSRGMQQKVSVLLNFVFPSNIILLDEPTLGMDVFSVEEFEKLIQSVRNEGKSVIITSHQLELIQKLSDKMIILNKGHILYDGSPTFFLEKYALKEYMLRYYENIPTKDLKRLSMNNIAYELSKNKDQLTILNQGNSDIFLKDILSLISTDKIKSINNTLPTLEDAYKNFWRIEEAHDRSIKRQYN